MIERGIENERGHGFSFCLLAFSLVSNERLFGLVCMLNESYLPLIVNSNVDWLGILASLCMLLEGKAVWGGSMY